MPRTMAGRKALYALLALLLLVSVFTVTRADEADAHTSSYKGHVCDGIVWLTCHRHSHRESTYHVHHYYHLYRPDPNLSHHEHRTVSGKCFDCILGIDPEHPEPEI